LHRRYKPKLMKKMSWVTNSEEAAGPKKSCVHGCEPQCYMQTAEGKLTWMLAFTNPWRRSNRRATRKYL